MIDRVKKKNGLFSDKIPDWPLLDRTRASPEAHLCYQRRAAHPKPLKVQKKRNQIKNPLIFDI
jgi:hypothetical protein